MTCILNYGFVFLSIKRCFISLLKGFLFSGFMCVLWGAVVSVYMGEAILGQGLQGKRS